MTTNSIKIIGAEEGFISPEFVDAKGARQIFGLSRAPLYNLITAGKIRSCCIRRPGAFRGRRLFDCESIRSFLRANMEGAV